MTKFRWSLLVFVCVVCGMVWGSRAEGADTRGVVKDATASRQTKAEVWGGWKGNTCQRRRRRVRRRRKARRGKRRRKERQRALRPKWSIPLPTDRLFRYVIRDFRQRRWWFVRTILQRRGLYQSQLMQYLRRERMPWELVLLAGIESNYRPLEYSWAHAAGMWQFIEKTGRRYGLRITAWRDERYDIPKATRAAAQYLDFLMSEFRQWEWAIAGYNCGEDCIRRVRRRCRGMSFWQARLTRRCGLPAETRQYVARFFAVLYFLRNPAEGRSVITTVPAFALKPAQIRGVVSLPTIAEGLGVSMKDMRNWNPELISWSTPPGYRYTLLVPPERYWDLRRVLKRPSPTYRLKMMEIRSEQELQQVARRFNVSSEFVRAINHTSTKDGLPEEHKVLVPLPRHARRWSASNSLHLASFAMQVLPWSKSLQAFRRKMLKLKIEHKREVCYQVEAGDAYWHIGRRFGISYRDIMRYNDGRRLHPGAWLRLAPGIQCPMRRRYVRTSNKKLAMQEWNQGYRLLHTHPHLDIGRRVARGGRKGRKDRKVGRRGRLTKQQTWAGGGHSPRCHRVMRGETLWGIARRYRMTSNRLLGLNPRSRRMLRAGAWLRLRPGSRCPRRTGS